jgi:uncharacterized protein involved in outer membrane biogenesis
MHLSSPLRLFLRSLFIGALILCVPVLAFLVLYAGPFEPLRRTMTEKLLSEAMGTKMEVRGPIHISSDWFPTVRIEDISAVESEQPPDLKRLSVKSIKFDVPLMPLLVGDVQLHTLVIDGLDVAIKIPQGGAEEDEDGISVAETVGDFVRSPYAGDFVLRDATVDYVNDGSGFDLHYVFDEIASRPSDDGGVDVDGTGRFNDEPWRLDVDVDPPGEDEDRRKFVLAVNHAGLKVAFAGLYAFDTSFFETEGDTVDMTVTASAPQLNRSLAVYDIKGELEGSGALSGRLAGSLDKLALSDLALKLAFESGDTYEATGNIADLMQGTGLALTLKGAFAKKQLPEGEVRPIYDIGVTGFRARIEGSRSGVLIRDFRLTTSAVRTNLRYIGPITAERLYKDDDGRLGLYDVLVLVGDPKRPSVRVEGTVKDIIGFKGVKLNGQIDFLTADLLDLAAEENAEALGHLSGDVAISDADGSLGIEKLSAKVTDSSLLKLSVDLAIDDLPEADELKLAIHLDIEKFKPFAAALGSEVEDVGRVKFDGNIAGGDEKIVMSGTMLVGQTTLNGALSGALSEKRAPVLRGDISTTLLHLSDLMRLASINVVFQENADDADVDVFDYSKVWETLFVDLQVKVAAIAGGGQEASNIQGRMTYLDGVIGLDPLTMTYLGGKASTNGKIDTQGNQITFALKGSVSNLRIGKVLKEMKVSYPVAGSLQATYDLSGAGDTKAQIPRSLSGSLTMSLRNGSIGTRLIDLTGMSLPGWLLARGAGGNQSPLVCVVAPFTFKNGRGTTRGLVLETANVQVVGVGAIDFRAETINLHFKPQALRRQVITTAQPFSIEGKLGGPRVKLRGAPAAGAVVGTLASPLNLLSSITQPRAGTPGRVPCRVVHGVPAAGQATTTKPRSRGPLGLGILGGQRRQ